MSMSGRMLRHARARAQLTQRELSAKVGIPQETIARIETGRVDPRVGTLDRLLEGCGFGLEHLPRLGIGVDRTVIRRLIELTASERLELGIANDRAMVERWQIRRVAE
jgi:transcriptional regulator with XRE-family HTH domain